MGKGDKKTKRGKIFMGSSGKTRPQKDKNIVTKPHKIYADSAAMPEKA